jgi:hypothetical protein
MSGSESFKRFAPCRDEAMEDHSYNPLHYAYLLWVDYLRAPNEADKQQLLVEAVSTLTVYRQCGHEGEELIALVAHAIKRRGRAKGLLEGSMKCAVETVWEDGRHKFAIFA